MQIFLKFSIWHCCCSKKAIKFFLEQLRKYLRNEEFNKKKKEQKNSTECEKKSKKVNQKVKTV